MLLVTNNGTQQIIPSNSNLKNVENNNFKSQNKDFQKLKNWSKLCALRLFDKKSF